MGKRDSVARQSTTVACGDPIEDATGFKAPPLGTARTIDRG